MLKENKEKIFKCNFCKNDYPVKFLGSILKKDQKAFDSENKDNIVPKKKLEVELTELKIQQLTNQKNNYSERQRIKELLGKINQRKENQEELVCQFCFAKFQVKKKEGSFICEVCQQEFEKEQIKEGHIENYQSQGISPRKWSKFCQKCSETRIILANLYCPRISEGRDDDWDINQPLYDCDCPEKL